MENPEIGPFDSPGREVPGEGSADLEKLLQTAEAENLQMVKLIDTERQKYEAYQQQIEETVKESEELEESTKHLDAKAKELHNKFKQNREICEGLRKTATVLDEHEETLRKKLEMVTLEQQTQLLQQNEDIEKYKKVWERYIKKYESMPLAMELSQIKQIATYSEMSVKENNEKITKIKSQIIDMEVEKAHMQEYLQGKTETATECIVKIARLFVEAERTAGNLREKLNELKDVRAKLSSIGATQPEPCDTSPEDATGIAELQQEQYQDDPETSIPEERTEVIQPEERPCDGQQLLTENEDVDDRGQLGNLNTSDATESVTEERMRYTAGQLLTYSQLPSRRQLQEQTEIDESTERQQTDSQPTAGNGYQRRTLLLISTPLMSHFNQQKKQTECPPDGAHDPRAQQEPPVSGTSQEKPPQTSGRTTPVQPSGSARPTDQPGSATPIVDESRCATPAQTFVRSPLDLSQHIKFIRQVTKSPGEGFIYTGRSMYSNNNNNNSNNDQVAESEEQPTNGQSEQEVIYEAPLNDQRDISLNFFQPFSQQSEHTDQNLFQNNVQPSPERNGSMFLQSSPASSAASPKQAFSFGSCVSSPTVNNSNFLSSSSPGGFFGRHNNQSDDSFNAGFSFFGSDNPLNSAEESSGGFSFSFGNKSPSKPSGSSGFSLF